MFSCGAAHWLVAARTCVARQTQLTLRQHNFATSSTEFGAHTSADGDDQFTPTKPWLAGRGLWRLRREHVDECTVPQAWVTSFANEDRHGLIDLHPHIWHVIPRLDILRRNIDWQLRYRNVSFTKSLTRAELPGSGKKIWPQKKVGRAHHGSAREPMFKGGGIVNGVRGPLTDFYMLPDGLRLLGLCTALTIKHTQNDVVVIDSFDTVDMFADEMVTHLHELADRRNWGYSVLFVDADDRAPTNLAAACAQMPSYNLLPVYGVNCHSLIKHETLVISVDAVLLLERRLLEHMHRARTLVNKFVYGEHKQRILREADDEFDNRTDQPSPFV